MDGITIVDKPAGWTSHDVVNRWRRLANTKKVGHLGTLDPMATGVLALVVGKATRLAQFYMRCEKTYDAVIHFGYSTDSYDREGNVTSPAQDVNIDAEKLGVALNAFRGVFQQTPPPISAKKVGGQPAYRLARKKIEVQLKPVEVTIHSLELIESNGAEIRLRVRCSTGTYLRSIAHELGQAMGCGAVLQDLRRVQLGDFLVNDAYTLEQAHALREQNRLEEAIIPVPRLLPDIPNEFVDTVTETQIRQGRDFHVSPFRSRAGTRYVKAISHEGNLVAIGEAKLPNIYHPILVL